MQRASIFEATAKKVLQIALILGVNRDASEIFILENKPRISLFAVTVCENRI